MNPVDGSAIFCWGPGHELFFLNGPFRLEGDSPLPLREFIATHPRLWLSDVVAPALAGTSPLLSTTDISLIGIISSDVDAMVLNVADALPPTEEFCLREGDVEIREDGDGVPWHVCITCDQRLTELTQEEYAAAMADIYEDLAFESYREDPARYSRGQG